MTTEHPNLAAAVAALQAELPVIPKSETANVPTKAGGSYSYTYAGLATITEKIMPVLAKHGLSFVAKPTFHGDRFVLAYSLLHASGEREDGEYPLPSSGGPQAIGSAITYGRRYCLCAATGVAPEDDDDGAAAEAEQLAQRGTARRAAAPRQQQTAGTTTTAKRASAPRPPAGDPPPLPGEEPAAGATTTPATTPPSAYSGNGRPAGADGPITQAQLGKLHASFKDAGVTTREEGLNFVIGTIGRQVESTKDMTKAEASKVIDALDTQPPDAEPVPEPPEPDGWQ